MLDMIRYISPCEAMTQPVRENESLYNRDQKEDVQKGIEYVFELNDKLRKLHPLAHEVVSKMLKLGY